MKAYKHHLVSFIACCTVFIAGCGAEPNDLQSAYKAKKGSYPLRTHHLDDSGEPSFTNRLIQQDSLYLLQHAHNPVDWWAWGDAAFTAAREADKPILLSIGYSTCHWCHVMERESFEDLKIAEYINQHFIPIKVDREEHPDVDELYLTAVRMLSGKAGWPLTAVLTPDGRPFFGGTYFAPEPFLNLLTQINTTWTDRRDAVLEQADRLKKALANINRTANTVKKISNDVIDNAKQRISNDFRRAPNPGQPAFPREPEMLFLLQRTLDTLDTSTIEAVQQRLANIANGGIHDQLDGGFHRYTVDANWQVPHFEKMLYNQAQLAQSYSVAYALSGDPKLRSIAEATFAFMLSKMGDPAGGFYAAMDAESDGREGAFYLWSYDELSSLLSDEELALASTAFGISRQGNFSGENILQNQAEQTDTPELKALQQKLINARDQRPKPRTDTKLITSWNSLAISALLNGSALLGDTSYQTAAINGAEVFWSKAYDKKRGLARTVPVSDTWVDGTLEDYAYFTNALLDLYDALGKEVWLERAKTIADTMIERFYDEQTGGFFISSNKDPNRVIVSLVTARDDALNSGNSMAAQALARLYRRSDIIDYRHKARSVLSAFAQPLLATPHSLSGMLTAASLLNQGKAWQTVYGGKGKVTVTTGATDNQLTVNIDIAPGWHINADKTLEKDLIPSKLSPLENHCTTVSEIQYPEGEMVKLGFQESELLVYEGKTQITASLAATDSSCRLIATELRIQACSDEVCLAPETLQIRTPLP